MSEQELMPRLDSLGRERRMVTLGSVEVNKQDGEGPIGFKGHASVFDSKALIRGWGGDWIEEVKPGAFRKTIQEADVRFLINHDPNLLLARNRAGTLRLAEDEIGLSTDADMAPTSYAKDLAINLGLRNVSQMSIGFNVVSDTWDNEPEVPTRAINEIRLFDVSVVTYPAFSDTDASLRGEAGEMICRCIGLSKDEQTAFLRHLIAGPSDPQFVASVRAAGEALERMAKQTEPAKSHSDLLRLRAALLHKKYLAASAA